MHNLDRIHCQLTASYHFDFASRSNEYVSPSKMNAKGCSLLILFLILCRLAVCFYASICRIWVSLWIAVVLATEENRSPEQSCKSYKPSRKGKTGDNANRSEANGGSVGIGSKSDIKGNLSSYLGREGGRGGTTWKVGNFPDDDIGCPRYEDTCHFRASRNVSSNATKDGHRPAKISEIAWKPTNQRYGLTLPRIK